MYPTIFIITRILTRGSVMTTNLTTHEPFVVTGFQCVIDNIAICIADYLNTKFNMVATLWQWLIIKCIYEFSHHLIIRCEGRRNE